MRTGELQFNFNGFWWGETTAISSDSCKAWTLLFYLEKTGKLIRVEVVSLYLASVEKKWS